MCMFTHSHISTNWHPDRQVEPGDQGLTGESAGPLVRAETCWQEARVKSSPATVVSAVWRNKIAIMDTNLIALQNHKNYYGDEVRKSVWVPVLKTQFPPEGAFKNVV